MAAYGWNKYRDAIISGDFVHVKKELPRLGFQVWLSDTRNALDLASQFGHMEIVKVFLDETRHFDDEKRDLLIVSAMHHACKAGQLDVFRTLLKEYGESNLRKFFTDFPEGVTGIHSVAVASGNIDLVRLVAEIWRDFPLDSRKLLRDAFATGSSEILEFVIQTWRFSIDGADLPVEKLFFHCALDHVDVVKRKVLEKKYWYVQYSTPDILDNYQIYDINPHSNSNGHEQLKMRLIGVAARFNHLELLKWMIKKLEEVASPIAVDDSLAEVLIQAWSTDRLEIVEWLYESGKIELKQVLSYPNILRYGRNTVFEYVNRLRPLNKDEIEALSTARENLTLTTEKSMDIIAYFLPSVKGMHDGFLREFIMADCSILVSKTVEYVTEFRCPTHHAHIDYALSCNFYSEKQLPCLPILETLLTLLPRGSACPCGHRNYFDLFLGVDNVNDYEEDDVKIHYDVFHMTSKSAAMMLLDHGATISGDVIVKLMHGIMTSHACLSEDARWHRLSRALCLTELMDITMERLPNLDPAICKSFITNTVTDDKTFFLLNFLRGLIGARYRQLDFPGLLCYIMRPERRRRVFTDLIQSLDLVVTDPLLEQLPPSVKSSTEYNELIVELTGDGVPSLKSIVRHSVFRMLRSWQHGSRSRGRVVDFQEYIGSFSSSPVITSLPRPLPELFRVPPMYPVDVLVPPGTDLKRVDADSLDSEILTFLR